MTSRKDPAASEPVSGSEGRVGNPSHLSKPAAAAGPTTAAAVVAANSRLHRVRSGYPRRSPRLISTVARLLGLLTLIDALVSGQRDHVHDLTRLIPVPVPVPATAAAAAVTAVCGFVLLRVAAGLAKRKRRAWALTLAAAMVMVGADSVRVRHLAGAAIAAVLVILLLTARSRFAVRSDPRTRWFAAVVVFQFLAVAVGYGLAVLYFSPDRLRGNPSFSARVQEVLYGLVGANGPVQLRGERFGVVVHATLLGFGLSTMIVGALPLLRPCEPIARLSAEEEQHLRALLARHSARDALGYFATRRDKSVLFSATGKAAVSYRVVHGVALISGDPIGDPEAWPGALAAYAQLVVEYGWTPASSGAVKWAPPSSSVSWGYPRSRLATRRSSR